MTENNKYWRGIEEQSNPELTEKLAQNEFANDISSAEFLGNEEVAESETSRRDFLKFMGFSTAAATLAACEAPIVESIPYVVKPDSLTPGLPSYYGRQCMTEWIMPPFWLKQERVVQSKLNQI